MGKVREATPIWPFKTRVNISTWGEGAGQWVGEGGRGVERTVWKDGGRGEREDRKTESNRGMEIWRRG